jgi:C_GCAxxG_C_C family probable redox protein
MNRPSAAREYMLAKNNCAQAIVATYAPQIGFSEDDLIHMAFPFGAGFGMQGLICGALSGAAMILGAKYGKILQGDEHYAEQVYGITLALFEQFRKINGTILCRELIHLDLSKPEGLAEAQKRGVFTAQCPDYVYQTSEILEKLLNTSVS